jgi:hypothetical protein
MGAYIDSSLGAVEIVVFDAPRRPKVTPLNMKNPLIPKPDSCSPLSCAGYSVASWPNEDQVSLWIY